MPEPLFKILEQYQVERCFAFNHNQSGLRAFLIIDNLVLGPAAGGIRTLPYASPEEALEDAIKLARAMTIKCALAGLDAGGGKAVVLEHKDLRRKEAFEELGRRVQELGGIFRTAGDLGTTKADWTPCRKPPNSCTPMKGICQRRLRRGCGGPLKLAVKSKTGDSRAWL